MNRGLTKLGLPRHDSRIPKEEPAMKKRNKNDGVTKDCACGRRKWSKCVDPGGSPTTRAVRLPAKLLLPGQPQARELEQGRWRAAGDGHVEDRGRRSRREAADAVAGGGEAQVGARPQKDGRDAGGPLHARPRPQAGAGPARSRRRRTTCG